MPDVRHSGGREGDAIAAINQLRHNGPCPVCRGDDHDALWWSKAGYTGRLCDDHKEAARSQRRLRYEFDQTRRRAFTMVNMNEPRR